MGSRSRGGNPCSGVWVTVSLGWEVRVGGPQPTPGKTGKKGTGGSFSGGNGEVPRDLKLGQLDPAFI